MRCPDGNRLARTSQPPRRADVPTDKVRSPMRSRSTIPLGPRARRCWSSALSSRQRAAVRIPNPSPRPPRTPDDARSRQARQMPRPRRSPPPNYAHRELDQHRRRHPQGVRHRSAQGALRFRLGQRAERKTPTHARSRSPTASSAGRSRVDRSSSSATPIRAAKPNTTSSWATRAPTRWAASCARRGWTRRRSPPPRAASSTRRGTDEPGWARDRRVDLMLGQ